LSAQEIWSVKAVIEAILYLYLDQIWGDFSLGLTQKHFTQVQG
jgi:hypothetical protein